MVSDFEAVRLNQRKKSSVSQRASGVTEHPQNRLPLKVAPNFVDGTGLAASLLPFGYRAS